MICFESENGCTAVATVEVSTSSGWVGFCERHVQWYRQKGEHIYPTRPVETARLTRLVVDAPRRG